MAKPLVSAGKPLQDSAGEVLAPLKPQSSKTWSSGSAAPSVRSDEVTVKDPTAGSRS